MTDKEITRKKEEFFKRFVEHGELDAPLEGQIVLTQDGVDELWQWIEELIEEVEKVTREDEKRANEMSESIRHSALY